MKPYLTAAAAFGLIGLSFAPTALPLTQPAAAANPSQTECAALGGQYIKDGPNSRCELPPTKPGRNPPGEQGSESQTTIEGQGNLNNKQETFCEGNKGQCKNPG